MLGCVGDEKVSCVNDHRKGRGGSLSQEGVVD